MTPSKTLITLAYQTLPTFGLRMPPIIGLAMMLILMAMPLNDSAPGADERHPTPQWPLVTESIPPWSLLDQSTLANHPLLMASPHPAEDAIEQVKRREISGLAETDGDRRVRKFLELVVLPMAVCVILIFVLRRGFLD